jgi:hypothetical protein
MRIIAANRQTAHQKLVLLAAPSSRWLLFRKLIDLQWVASSIRGVVQDLPEAHGRGLSLLHLRAGLTLTGIRDLIPLPPETEQALPEYETEHPKEHHAIERVIEFRGLVSRQFERLSQSRSP